MMRIGFLNIMPEAEKYEKYIYNLLENQPVPVDIILIKAKNHNYKSSNKKHLDQFYITFDQAIERQKLDGLILTGAPVETFPFEKITYWQELVEIFDYAKLNITSTMGLCWGAIAIGKYLGINSVQFMDKLFGVFSSEYLKKEHWMTDTANLRFDCPQSRYAGMNEKELTEAENNGIIRLLVNSEEAGHYVFESADERFIAHLGHPEYDTNRIIAEYERDINKGLPHFPKNFDIKMPVKTWDKHGKEFFSKWLKRIEELQN